MDFVLQMWRFLGARRKFWLLPIIIVTVLIGGVLVLAPGSVVAPFIYTLFLHARSWHLGLLTRRPGGADHRRPGRGRGAGRALHAQETRTEPPASRGPAV